MQFLLPIYRTSQLARTGTTIKSAVDIRLRTTNFGIDIDLS